MATDDNPLGYVTIETVVADNGLTLEIQRAVTQYWRLKIGPLYVASVGGNVIDPKGALRVDGWCGATGLTRYREALKAELKRIQGIVRDAQAEAGVVSDEIAAQEGLP